MNLFGWIDRLDDRINPIVVKELRQAVKSRVITAMLLLFLSVQLLIVALFLAFQGARDSGDPLNGHSGHQLFLVLQAILLGTCMVLIPTYAAVRMSAERSETNVDLLFISTLRPTSIIAGKFFSSLVVVMLVFSCCAPFMTFTYLLRGIDIPSILFVLGIDLLAVLLSTQFGLFLASIPGPRPVKFFLFFMAFLMLCWIYGGLVVATSELLREGVVGATNSEFWAGMGVLVLAVLFFTGLLFCWSVALISPPSANRALLSRLFLVGTWLILGGACLGLTYLSAWGPGDRDIPVMVWAICSVITFCVQFLVSLNERDSWGPRVTRTIPRWHPLRILAFLFYSGSAGGVLLSVLCIFLTLLLGWSWCVIHSTFGRGKEEVLQVFAAMALYTFCYGMSAVLLRAYLLRTKVRQGFTWLLVLLLVVLGCSVPWLGAFIVYSDTFSYRGGLAWWLIPNPMGSLIEIGAGHGFLRDEYTVFCFVFLSVWALVLGVLSIPWLFGQLARFRPSTPRVSGKASGAPAEKLPEVVLVTPAEAR